MDCYVIWGFHFFMHKTNRCNRQLANCIQDLLFKQCTSRLSNRTIICRLQTTPHIPSVRTYGKRTWLFMLLWFVRVHVCPIAARRNGKKLFRNHLLAIKRMYHWLWITSTIADLSKLLICDAFWRGIGVSRGCVHPDQPIQSRQRVIEYRG